MSNSVNLTIDGKEIQVPAGTNLIDAADSAGIHIPNLCYLKGMRGIGACRMCLIEVEGGKAPLIGCTTKVKEGMVVNTKTEKVEEVRKFVIDLILSMHPLDCMTCTKAGVCTLQQYAYDFGIKESSFSRKKMGYAVDEANPFIKRDPDYCILCGRCVRVCNEQGTNVLEFMGRGVGSKVVTAMDRPLQDSDCTFCGSCVDACPVNALLEADRWRKGREWDYTKNTSVCLSCGNGCDLSVSSSDGVIAKLNSGAEDGSAEKFLCAIGRFGFDAVASDARITSPMKNVNGKFEDISWDEAIKTVSDKLKSAGAKAGIISSGNILNEDAAALSRLAADAVKTKNADSSVSLYADADSMNNSSSLSLDDADTIVLAGIMPNQWSRVLPALSAGIKRRVARGAKLVVINSSDTNFMSSETVALKVDEEKGLAHIAKALLAHEGVTKDKDVESAVSSMAATEDVEKAAEILADAKSAVVFCSPALFGAAQNLSLLAEIKVVAVPFEANARGVVAAGLSSQGKSFKEMSEGGVDVLYAVGDVPVSAKPKAGFVIAQASYLTGIAKDADIVLPAAASLESEGTITNYLGKTKTLNKCIESAGDSRQHKDIIVAISEALGSAVSSEAVTAPEAAKASFSSFEKKAGLDADAAGIRECSCDAVLNKSRLLWLKENQEAAV